jgi:hypothetical protein
MAGVSGVPLSRRETAATTRIAPATQMSAELIGSLAPPRSSGEALGACPSRA